MQIGRDQGRFITLLLCCLGARRTIEVGVFTGYSTLITALALPNTGYDGYYERCLALLRPGGVIAIDNALWGGSVADSAKNSEDTQAIRALNEKISRDPRVEAHLAPVGDGVYLAWKR